jgi:poly-beta-1,6-N-acetyl-D-glucosamine synthase
MLLSILFYIFIVVGTIHLIHFALFLIGANVYDMKSLYWGKRTNANEKKRPLVTVLVPAFNEGLVIERCLQSIWNNTYSKIEIVVVNDGSTDDTQDAIQRFINSRTRTYRKTAPKIVRTKNSLKREWVRGNLPVSRRIVLVSQRNAGKGAALNNALRSHTKGELVMSLDADSVLHRRAIDNLIKYFDDPKVAGVAANVRIIEKNRVLGILQRFEHMVGYRSKKFYTVTNSELIIGGVASTYRRDVLKRVNFYDTDTVTEDIGLSMKIASLGNRENRLIYAADVIAMTEGVKNFPALLRQRYRWKMGNLQNIFKYRSMTFSGDNKYSLGLRWYRMPMAFIGELLLLLEPIALAYITYLSIHYYTPALIMSAYMSICLYLLFIIWPDEHMSVKGKLKASLYIPFLYFIFYIMNFVQLISILRCIKNQKTVFGLSAGHTNWLSAERTGGAVKFS